MIFGKKNKNTQKDLSGDPGNASLHDNNDEIELACRDLVLAGLESMRKEIVVRDHDKKADNIENVILEKEEISDETQSEKKDRKGEDTLQNQNCVELQDNSECYSVESCNYAVPIEQHYSLEADKQIIIDMIAAEDIKRALRYQ